MHVSQIKHIMLSAFNPTRSDILIKQLKLNDLISRIDKNSKNDYELSNVLTQIVHVFGGYKPFLSTIILSGCFDINQLQQSHKIIKSMICHQKDINNENQQQHIQEDDENNNKLTLNVSIPIEINYHIVGYLNKVDIIRYKKVCRSTAITCLQFMKQIPVTILFQEKTLLTTPNLRNTFCLKNNPLKYISRHSLETKFHTMYEIWSKQYNIPFQHLLIFRQHPTTKHPMITNVDMKIGRLSLRQAQTRFISRDHYDPLNFFLYDQRKLVVINSEKISKFNIDILNENEKYDMKQINFFDILTQKLYTVGYVLWHHETPLNQLRKYLTLKCLYTLYIYISVYEYTKHMYI